MRERDSKGGRDWERQGDRTRSKRATEREREREKGNTQTGELRGRGDLHVRELLPDLTRTTSQKHQHCSFKEFNLVRAVWNMS